MPLFSRKIRKNLKEFRTDISPVGLRSSLNALKGGFLNSPTSPSLRDTKVNLDKVRSIYYNTNDAQNFGNFLGASIVDGTADFIGLPQVSFKDVNLTSEVNNWIENYWGSAFWQIYRNAMRDTMTWVRFRLPYPSPLLAPQEENICLLEIVDADRVAPYYNPATQELIRVEIETEIFVEDSSWNPNLIASTGARVYGRVHNIREVITKDSYYYYDSTTGEFLEDYTTDNGWGIVPMVPVYNDYDSSLHGGRSELEVAYPFFNALHDLITQTRKAHSYHADPKVKFALKDVMNFLRNNFKDSFNSDGEFTGRVSWKDRDVFFLEDGEDASFITASMNEGDSTQLANFLIDCICMAAQVTEGVLFRAHTEQQTANTDEFFRFKKKVNRKRTNFTDAIKLIVKMAMYISTKQVAAVPNISWPAIDVADLAAEGQALNGIVTATEVANRAGALSVQTYREKIRPFFPAMKSDTDEQAQVDAEQAKEQSTQVDLAKQMALITPPRPNTNGNTGVNGANGRTRLPVEVTAPGD